MLPSHRMKGHDIVVIGASAGGLAPLQELVAGLSPALPATILVVVHGSRSERLELPAVIAGNAALPVRFAAEREALKHGVLLLAPPDRHLLVKQNEVWVTRGPRENDWRPSIDVLFRSAAIAGGPGTIGLVLSGALDDGTAGLAAIRACGGITLVQDPEEAQFREMPDSVLRSVEVTRVVRTAKLAQVIEHFVKQPAGLPQMVPEHLKLEARFAEDVMPMEEDYARLGSLSQQTCPECGGPLLRASDDIVRFRCLTGHAYSGTTLDERMRRDVETSLWSAIRLFQQRSNLDRALAQKESEKGRLQGADQYASRAAEAEGHAVVLHDLLMKMPD